jgi:hypothetical protein
VLNEYSCGDCIFIVMKRARSVDLLMDMLLQGRFYSRHSVYREYLAL